MDSQTPREFLINVALEVHDLIKRPGICERFRQNIKQWDAIHRAAITAAYQTAPKSKSLLADIEHLPPQNEENVHFRGPAPLYLTGPWSAPLHFTLIALVHDLFIQEIRERTMDQVALIVHERFSERDFRLFLSHKEFLRRDGVAERVISDSLAAVRGDVESASQLTTQVHPSQIHPAPDARRWPEKNTLVAICDQTQKLCEMIHDLLPTTSQTLPFAPNGLPTVVVELDRLTYLFFGRTLDDYDADVKRARQLGWLGSLVEWIVATPGSIDWPGLSKAFEREPLQLWCHNQFPGWNAQVRFHGEALVVGLMTLRSYFGRITFNREMWIPAGDWLRERLHDFAECHDPSPALGPWFDGKYCRVPLYGLRRPPTYGQTSQEQQPLPVPPEIERCGTYENPKMHGVPTEWLDSMQHHAMKLRAALHRHSTHSTASSGSIAAGAAGPRHNAGDVLQAHGMNVPESISEARRTFLELCDEAIARAAAEQRSDTSLGGLPALIHRFARLSAVLTDPQNVAGKIPPFRFEMKRRQLPLLPDALSQVFAINNPTDLETTYVLATADSVIETQLGSMGSDRFVVNEEIVEDAKRAVHEQLGAWLRYLRNDASCKGTHLWPGSGGTLGALCRESQNCDGNTKPELSNTKAVNSSNCHRGGKLQFR